MVFKRSSKPSDLTWSSSTVMTICPPQAVDLDDFQRRLQQVPPLDRPADEFAPVPHVGAFRELPLAEIDEAMAKLEAAHAEAKARHQAARDLIMRIRQDELELLERARKATELHSEAFAAMTKGIAALYEPPPAEPPPLNLDRREGEGRDEKQGEAA